MTMSNVEHNASLYETDRHCYVRAEDYIIHSNIAIRYIAMQSALL